MRKATLRAWIVAAALAVAAPVAAASSFHDALREADRIRSAEPRRLSALLADLDRRRAEATPADLRLLRLLHDYDATMRGDFGAALGDAIALFDQAPEPGVKFRAGLLVANVAALTRDFSIGLLYLERAMAMRQQVADPEIRELGDGVAAVLYNQYGQYDLGLHYAERLVEHAVTPRNRCAGRQLRLEALQGLKKPLDEEGDVQAALSDCAAQNEPIATNLVRDVLAQHWAGQGKRTQAIALLEASLPEVESTGYSRLIAEVHGLLARYKLDEGDVADAEVHARTVADLKGQDPRWLPSVTAHRVLYEIALRRGDYRRALDEYRRYAEADKARLDDIKAREYAFQLSRHQLKQKNQSIALLQNQNQLLRLQQEVARRSAWNTRLAIALLLVLVASLGYWIWRARRTHSSLRTLADTDGLTGLANRRHFRARSEAALALAAQRRRPVSVLLFDLDHFKQINDQCGHSAGDWVLREVARVGRLHGRDGDLFGRIGGEEFAMTLVDCDVDAALRIAEACRRAIAAIDASATGCALPVAASIGVAGTAHSGYDYETLIAHADAAMYRSKVGGRNRVSLYEPPPAPAAAHSVIALERRNAETMLRQY